MGWAGIAAHPTLAIASAPNVERIDLALAKADNLPYLAMLGAKVGRPGAVVDGAYYPTLVCKCKVF